MRPRAKRARAPWTVGSEQSLSPLDIDILLSYMFSPRSTRFCAFSLLSCLFLSFFLLNLFFFFSCLIPCTIISRRRLRQTRPCKLLFSATNYLVALLASFLPFFSSSSPFLAGPCVLAGTSPAVHFLHRFRLYVVRCCCCCCRVQYPKLRFYTVLLSPLPPLLRLRLPACISDKERHTVNGRGPSLVR